MPEESLKKKTVKGMFWSSLERFSVQAVQFLVMIVIARLLSPEEYGLIGMLAIFIAVSQSLVNSGFSQALIRKQNRSDKDNCTVFYFNIVVSAVLYLPNAYVGAHTEIADNAFIGQCSILISEKAKYIGEFALIGAGYLVTKSVHVNSVVAGHSARIIKYK